MKRLGILAVWLSCCLVLAACSGDDSTTTPATPVPGVSTEVPTSGGEASLPNGTKVILPPNAASTPVSVSLATEGSVPASEEYMSGVGTPVHIQFDPGSLDHPATIELPFDIAALPPGSTPDEVFVAYYDEEAAEWIPVGGVVDASRGVVIVQTTHASWWNPFSWNWDAWIAALSKVLDVKVTSLFEAVQLITTSCEANTGTVSVQDSSPSQLIKGCVDREGNGTASARVINLKSFHVGVTASGGSADRVTTRVLDPGETISFDIDLGTSPPLTIQTVFSDEAMQAFVAHLIITLLPASEMIPADGVQAIGKELADAGELGAILEAAEDRNPAKLAEEIVSALSRDTFIRVFVNAAVRYGQQHGVSMMTKLTEKGVKQLFFGVLATNVIVKSFDFAANYAVSYFGSSSISFQWDGPKQAWIVVNRDDQLVVARTDGSSERQLTSGDGGGYAGTSTENGERWIYYTSLVRSGNEGTFTVHRQKLEGGSESTLFSFPANNKNVEFLHQNAWVSPSGSSIAYSAVDGIHLRTSDGSDSLVLANNRAGCDGPNISECWGHYFPEWSPNGKQISFQRIFFEGSRGYLLDTTSPGAAPTQLKGDAGSWSPDGARLCVLQARSPYDPYSELSLVTSDGASTAVALPSAANKGVGDCAWTPDGRFAVTLSVDSTQCPSCPGKSRTASILLFDASARQTASIPLPSSTGYQNAVGWLPGGAGLIVSERPPDALEFRNVAVGMDGRTLPITLPSGLVSDVIY